MAKKPNPTTGKVVVVPKKIGKRKLKTMSMDELAQLPGMLDLYMYDPRGGHLFDSAEVMPHKRLVTGNQASGEKWIEHCEALGLVFWDDVVEERDKLMGIIGAARRNNGQGTYDPASIANKTGGQRPSRRPTRDRQMPASVRNNGTVVNRYVKP